MAGTAVSVASRFPEGKLPVAFKAVTSGVRLLQLPGIPVLMRLLMSAGAAESHSRDLRIGSATLH
jgi:hypothetical protein